MRSKFLVRFVGGLTVITFALCIAVTSSAQSSGSKITGRSICHLTGNAVNPYELIVVRQSARASHLGHGDVEAENGSCPSVLPMSWSSGSRGSGNAEDQKRNGSAASSSTSGTNQGTSVNGSTTASEEENMTAICHREGDGSYHLNTVSSNAVDAHLAHGDTYPEDGACLSGTTGGGNVEPGATPEPITMLLFGAGLAGIGYFTRRRLSVDVESSLS